MLNLIMADAAVVLTAAVLVFLPDLNAVLARMFTYDKFYHLDIFLMSPAWAHHQGLTLNQDVTSGYSLLLPLIFDCLLKAIGHFDYAEAVGLMITFCAAYYLMFYCFLRVWTKSVLLAAGGLFLALKLQFFHWGVTPLIWIYPSATPLRFFPDIFFIFFLWRYSQAFQVRWLAAAAGVAGLGLVWALDVGVYMYMTLGLAVMCGVWGQGPRALPKGIAIVLIPAGVALAILTAAYGGSVFQQDFWHNTFEFAALFLGGWGALPMTQSLGEKQFFACAVGFAIPVIYLVTFVYGLGAFYLSRRAGPPVFMALISGYGLGLYHYFIHRSGVSSYYVVVIPLIVVLLFWAQQWLARLSPGRQGVLKICFSLWSLAALTTGYLFAYYPNVLNLSGTAWGTEKDLYIRNFDFGKDARMIEQLVPPDSPAALVSSFETKILMQAKRKPFFYYFPLVESAHMDGVDLRGLHVYTRQRLAKTLGQMANAPPRYLFIEQRLYAGSLAAAYEHSHEAFRQMMAYVRAHYRLARQGQYLVALERNR